jgi:hypothetical protein
MKFAHLDDGFYCHLSISRLFRKTGCDCFLHLWCCFFYRVVYAVLNSMMVSIKIAEIPCPDSKDLGTTAASITDVKHLSSYN